MGGGVESRHARRLVTPVNYRGAEKSFRLDTSNAKGTAGLATCPPFKTVWQPN